MSFNIKFGKTDITFILKRRERKTMAIHVYPDKSIEVIAPANAPLEKISAKIKKRAPWIIRKQLEFERLQPKLPRPQFIPGETYRFLGNQYQLRIENYPKIMISINHRNIVLGTPIPLDSTIIKKTISNWYRKKSTEIFKERFVQCLIQTTPIGIEKEPEWTIRIMPKRWGSCTKKNRILLHPELVAAPKDCIDYVIIHELCHIIVYNHSNRFYKLLEKVLPDWKDRRKKLNENVEVRMM